MGPFEMVDAASYNGVTLVVVAEMLSVIQELLDYRDVAVASGSCGLPGEI